MWPFKEQSKTIYVDSIEKRKELIDKELKLYKKQKFYDIDVEIFAYKNNKKKLL